MCLPETATRVVVQRDRKFCEKCDLEGTSVSLPNSNRSQVGFFSPPTFLEQHFPKHSPGKAKAAE